MVTSGSTLRILSVGDGAGSAAAAAAAGADDDEAFNSNRVNLRYTPREMCLLPAKVGESSRKIVLAIVENDTKD